MKSVSELGAINEAEPLVSILVYLSISCSKTQPIELYVSGKSQGIFWKRSVDRNTGTRRKHDRKYAEIERMYVLPIFRPAMHIENA